VLAVATVARLFAKKIKLGAAATRSLKGQLVTRR
jgi:hypothetical protein